MCDKSKIYPELDLSNGKNNTKHLLLTSDTLKKIMMVVDTNKGDKIRDYYVALEKLMKNYCIYIKEYNEEKNKRDKQELEEKNKRDKQELEDNKKQLEVINNQLLIERNKNIIIQNVITNVKLLEKK